jgi:hypothetical protein
MNNEILCILHEDAPKKWVKKWENLLKINPRYIAHRIKSFCKLESNKSLPLLDRCEGLLGGNSNTKDKQLRIMDTKSIDLLGKTRLHQVSFLYSYRFSIFNSGDGLEKWTNEEIEDIAQSIKQVYEEFMDDECVFVFVAREID